MGLIKSCLIFTENTHTHTVYLADWANCWAAVTASSGLVTSMGTLLQPGCLSTLSSCRTVFSTVPLLHRSTLLTTMKMGTFSAMARPRCSRVVPAEEEEENTPVKTARQNKEHHRTKPSPQVCYCHNDRTLAPSSVHKIKKHASLIK